MEDLTGQSLDRRIWKSMIGDRIWLMKDMDPESFKREVKDYFARGNPGFTPIRAKYPFIYLRDDRRS